MLCTSVLFTLTAQKGDWPTYGGDSGGSRYSALSQIDRENVSRLKVAWTYHTGALVPGRPDNAVTAFEATPVLFNGLLYLTTPFDQVIALDPVSGKERWKFDPQVNRNTRRSIATSRGVAVWQDGTSPRHSLVCQQRIFAGTLDARLIALDAVTGKPCVGFGENGIVGLTKDVEFRAVNDYQITSPPTVVGHVVIVGSSIGDNRAVDEELGVVRGFDARSGSLLWTWDPIPWAKRQHPRTGAGNAWSVISADLQRGLIFIPTGSASPDFYGGMRPGDNRYADSVVALEAATGKFVWGFQVVHHDLWDYDVAAQPLLFTFRDGTPAVAVSTKMGLVFVLDRLTGKPLYPVEEKSVPKSDIPGESASATQPFPALPPLGPLTLSNKDVWGETSADRTYCAQILASVRSEGIYTPPSSSGTLLFPGNVGGVNWGSTALDPNTGILYANTNRVAFLVKLVPRQPSTWQRGTRYLNRKLGRSYEPNYYERLQHEQTLTNRFTGELSEQKKTPYMIYREAFMSRKGLPCTLPPWGTVSALNLNTGQKEWEVPLGTMVSGEKTGSINLGGPIVTAGGLVFTAASLDGYLRAFDSKTGRELWKAILPAPAVATPLTYSASKKQFIVICAGGDGMLGTKMSDAVIAFSLP